MQTTKLPGSNIRYTWQKVQGKMFPAKQCLIYYLWIIHEETQTYIYIYIFTYSAISQHYLTLCKTPPPVPTAPLQPSLSQTSSAQGDGGLHGCFPWFRNLLRLQRGSCAEIKLPLCWSTGGSYSRRTQCVACTSLKLINNRCSLQR